MLREITLFGQNIILYDVCNTVVTVLQIVFVFFLTKEYKGISTLPILAERYLNKKKDFFFNRIYWFVEASVVFAVVFAICQGLAPGISKLFVGKITKNFFAYIFVLPPLAFLVGILLKVSPLKLNDFFAPVFSFALIFYKLACVFEGCCYGIEWNNSPYYNQKHERYEMPVALIEMACAIVIFVIIMGVRRRKKTAGVIYPLFMLLYCGSRFCSEFLRDDYPAVWGVLKGYQIALIIGFVLGVIYMIIVMKYSERITNYFETKNKAFLEEQLKIYEKKHKPRKRKKH